MKNCSVRTNMYESLIEAFKSRECGETRAHRPSKVCTIPERGIADDRAYFRKPMCASFNPFPGFESLYIIPVFQFECYNSSCYKNISDFRKEAPI